MTSCNVVLDDLPPVHGCTYSFTYVILPTQPAHLLVLITYFCKYVSAFTNIIILPTPTALCLLLLDVPPWHWIPTCHYGNACLHLLWHDNLISSSSSSHGSLTSHPSSAVIEPSPLHGEDQLGFASNLDSSLRLLISLDAFSSWTVC